MTSWTGVTAIDTAVVGGLVVATDNAGVGLVDASVVVGNAAGTVALGAAAGVGAAVQATTSIIARIGTAILLL
ncbi:MAG: hypothetical protein KDD92_19700 [Caldilineaceae bacterium]|nr:hypothetical protein [Caldilineaceae bacterium]